MPPHGQLSTCQCLYQAAFSPSKMIRPNPRRSALAMAITMAITWCPSEMASHPLQHSLQETTSLRHSDHPAAGQKCQVQGSGQDHGFPKPDSFCPQNDGGPPYNAAELCLDPLHPNDSSQRLQKQPPALSTGPEDRSRVRKCTHCASAIFSFFLTLAVDEPFEWDHRSGYRVYRDCLTQSHLVSIKP